MMLLDDFICRPLTAEHLHRPEFGQGRSMTKHFKRLIHSESNAIWIGLATAAPGILFLFLFVLLNLVGDNHRSEFGSAFSVIVFMIAFGFGIWGYVYYYWILLTYDWGKLETTPWAIYFFVFGYFAMLGFWYRHIYLPAKANAKDQAD